MCARYSTRAVSANLAQHQAPSLTICYLHVFKLTHACLTFDWLIKTMKEIDFTKILPNIDE